MDFTKFIKMLLTAAKHTLATIGGLTCAVVIISAVCTLIK